MNYSSSVREKSNTRKPALMKEPARRFPLPWHVDEATESFCIRDANGEALAYVYFEDGQGRRMAMHRLTRSEARRSSSKHF